MEETISTLYQAATKFPDMSVTIKLKDLMAANRELIAEARAQLEDELDKSRRESYPTRKEVMEMLRVSEATLWRWQKTGYLVPLNVGGKRRYRMSDVQQILKGGAAC